MATKAAKVFFNDQLSNADYHADTEYISGSSLAEIYLTCPAKWKYRERDEDEKKTHLNFGTVGHTLMLEPERFDKEYIRVPKPSDYQPAEGGKILVLDTQTKMSSWLKERGVAGRSKATTPQAMEDMIIEVVNSTPDEIMPVLYMRELRELESRAEAGNFELVKADDYDAVLKMRNVLMANQGYSNIITSGISEVSIFTTLYGVKVKVRLDKLLDEMAIWDYKTTTDASPEWFTNHACKLGYFMKMALQHHCFKKAYARNPTSVNLLAQEKKSPFLPENYILSRAALRIGEIQLKSALKTFSACQKSGIWPSYGGGKPVLLEPSDWVKKQYNVEDEE